MISMESLLTSMAVFNIHPKHIASIDNFILVLFIIIIIIIILFFYLFFGGGGRGRHSLATKGLNTKCHWYFMNKYLCINTAIRFVRGPVFQIPHQTVETCPLPSKAAIPQTIMQLQIKMPSSPDTGIVAITSSSSK